MSQATNIFERASKQKLRFNTPKGKINTEDLWDLTLEDLDKLAISLNKQLKESDEESFIKARSTKSTKVQLQFDLVKHVLDVKVAAVEAERERAEKRQRREQILDILSRKEAESLQNKTEDELRQELATLEV